MTDAKSLVREQLETDASSLKRRKAVNGSVAEDDLTINGSVRPFDWPAAKGEIDLAIHDLPHVTSETEWWYVNMHVRSEDGREFSGFASFFRTVRDFVKSEDRYRHGHALTWGLIDVQNKTHLFDAILDVHSPEMILDQLKNASDSSGLDPRLRNALQEMLLKGEVPLPDRTMKKEATAFTDRLELHYDENSFVKDANGSYHVHCEHKASAGAFSLTFTPTKPVIRHGHGGVVKIGRKGDDMFYYFIPRMTVEGTVTIKGQSVKVKGQGWFDHEFGGFMRDGPHATAVQEPTHGHAKGHTNGHANGSQNGHSRDTIDYAWNWLAAQLDDGTDISSTLVHNFAAKKDLDNFSVVIDPDGTRHEFNDDASLFTGEDDWVSVRTCAKYPTKWKLDIPAADIHLVGVATFPEQECITLLAKPAFWEGILTVSGTIKGKPVTGRAFLERHGFYSANSLDKFFGTISKLVGVQTAQLLPLEPTYESTLRLIASQDMKHLMDGASSDVYTKTVVKPIREIADRGGKSWRSYALLLCADAVGGNSYSMLKWLSMPEIMHVGSLIVDDIQDKSIVRRGGPTCHSVHGEALAINCGTAAYFIGSDVVRSAPLTPELKVKMYELYLLTLRAGHAGQAFDIYGLDYLMDDAVATGNNKTLVERVTCTHRLKSAVPAGNLARMGGIFGGGSDDQIERLGRYFESVGVAFQIIDDVLNLKGFESSTKDLGEDIKAGKITYPVCVAFDEKRLNLEQRKWLWETIKSKPQQNDVVGKAIQLIDSCGALEKSEQDATDMVEAAWRDLDAVLPPSVYKLRIRAFGHFVLQRHY